MKQIQFFLIFGAFLYGGEQVKLSHEMLVEISDELIREDLAEVDIDPEAFDVTTDKPKSKKKSDLDGIEFISEREK